MTYTIGTILSDTNGMYRITDVQNDSISYREIITTYDDDDNEIETEASYVGKMTLAEASKCEAIG